MSYDNPRLHWNQKASWYLKDGGNPFYARKLKGIISRKIREFKPCSLLEVGCGPGRLFPIYAGVPNVSVVDFSYGMLRRAVALKKKMGYDIDIFNMDINHLLFLDSCFDMVVSSNVLLHVPHEKIERVVGEIARVCRGVVVCVEYFEERQSEVSDFCFLHDYPLLFGDAGCCLVEERKIWFEDQKLFVFKVKK